MQSADAEESSAADEGKPRIGVRMRALAARAESTFPGISHSILLAGLLRLGDYQDERYAAEYLDRLEDIRDLDSQHGPGEFALLRETGRYLALWMSYEDAIRVADLKIRRARFERVRDEAQAGDDQLVQIKEYLHPRIDEIADILPVALGQWLLRSGIIRRVIERLTRKGKLVETTSLGGFLQLYAIASLRPLRRRSLRFHREHQAIAAWLAQIPPVVREDYALACEVAMCPRLVKGYGDTHHRGTRNFAAVMGALPHLRGRANAASELRRLREAALADETSELLEQALRDVA
jgi:indolepyruvate ferredoxin oxidoreductase beta subunit